MRARDKHQGTHAWKRGAEGDVDWAENVEQGTSAVNRLFLCWILLLWLVMLHNLWGSKWANTRLSLGSCTMLHHSGEELQNNIGERVV